MLDVLGRDLAAASAALEEAGCRVEAVETRTPRQVALTGPLRVVRQREGADGTVRLAVTRERYEPVAGTAGG